MKKAKEKPQPQAFTYSDVMQAIVKVNAKFSTSATAPTYATMMTFDEMVSLYEAGPVKFLEGILKHRYERRMSDECVSCREWDKINHRRLRHITSKDHKRLGNLPWPHKFEPDVGFYLLSNLNEVQLLHHIARLRRHPRRVYKDNGLSWEDEADLLSLYHREKGFLPKEKCAEVRA